MSVLIKGMEMPSKKNGAVIILYPNGTAVFEDGKEYQVMELPPHGDLIDRNDLVKWIITEIADYSEDDKAIVTKTLMEMLPTIIEAERDTFDGYTRALTDEELASAMLYKKRRKEKSDEWMCL